MKKISVIIILSILVGAAVYAWKEIPRHNPYSQIPREKVKRGDFVISIEEVGVIKARKREFIYAPFSGKITRIIDDGSSVTKNQTVIWLDTEDVEKKLEEQITNLKSTKMDMEQTIEQLVQGIRNNTIKVETTAAELEFARLKLQEVNRNLETIQLLVDRNILAKTNVDRARQEVESEKFQTLKTDLDFQTDLKGKEEDETSRKAELGKVKQRGIRAQKRIEDARNKITEAEIKAPAEGIFLLIERWDWQKGRESKPQEGDQIWERQTLGEIPDLSSLIICSQVSEEDVSKVRIGQEARITTNAFKDLAMSAKVSRIGIIAIPRNASPAGSLAHNSEDTGQRVFELDLTLDQIDPRLKPGMTADISIILDTLPGALNLPLSVVFRNEGRAVVYRPDKNSYGECPVTLGRRNRDRIEILSGLREGDEVYTKNLGEMDRES
ncbi:HlyD family efflux transporter periplasmic adaptor subunit [Candidatus Sumerlaeota bacterium]|nr:HlyD family efflux transporter periplasmic adaptor subunit [Candidatus Sumerlaeota bacterium]